MEEVAEYLRCRNCNTFFESESSYGQWYCTKVCAEQYETCLNCGRFFRVSKKTISEEEEVIKKIQPQAGREFCTPDCAKDYTEEFRLNMETRGRRQKHRLLNQNYRSK